jgi:alpha-L-fucosidase
MTETGHQAPTCSQFPPLSVGRCGWQQGNVKQQTSTLMRHKETMNINRRHFLHASVAAAGGLALPGRLFAAEASEANALPPHLKAFGKTYLKNPRQASLEWFRDAKFGLMICYGLYSLDGIHPFEQRQLKIPVTEYEKKAARFTAEKFDAGALCDLAVEAGMKYVTFVTKHCDGFCLWDTKHTSFNSMRSAAKRDFVAELVKACNERGLGFFAFYEYGFEWRHPHGPRLKDFSTPITEVPYPTPEPT